MTTEEFITELYCRVDDQMRDVPKHPQAKLYPSEVVTLALLFALKGVGATGVLSLVEPGLSPFVSKAAGTHPTVSRL